MPSSKHTSYAKRTVRIDSETRGWELDVWQLTPRHVRAPFPTVVIAHGFTLHKIHGLQDVAEGFLRNGCACLVFDYRHFGESDGTPRNYLSPTGQVEDYQTVIRYAKRRPDMFNPRAIGVWGFSYSGGHVLTLAAKDPSLAFAISQNPSVGGMAQAADMNPFHCLRLGACSMISMSRQLMGMGPLYVRASSGRNGWGLLNMKESSGGFEQVGYSTTEARCNRIDAKFALASLFYNPTYFSAPKIRIPVLVCLGKSDSMVPFREAKKCAGKIDGAELYIYNGGHFSAFPGGPALEEVSKVQTDFVLRHV